MKPPRHPAYLIQSVVHAARILEVFRSDGEVLRLRDVVSRTGFNKGKCFRLLYTLHSCGFLEKVGENQYRAVARLRPRRKFRIGYAEQGQDSSFPREVTASMIRAAEEAEIELIVLDNRYDAKTALRNADLLLREEVDLVVEFQADEAVAPAIAGKFLGAKIPMIAIDIPHPGATYFGANNYEAGLIAGRHLGRWAIRNWEGQVDEILMIEIARAGSLPQARIRGMLAGLHETLRVDSSRAVLVDGDGQFGATMDAVRKYLRASRSKRILVGAATDPSALGAVRAFDEAGRGGECAVAGHNAELEGRLELRNPRTSFIGTVAYFPERYGPGVIRLALDILSGKPVPPAVFTRHTLITAENVDRHYPSDLLLAANARALVAS